MLLWYTSVKCDGSFLILLQKFKAIGCIELLSDIWLNVNVGSAIVSCILLGYITFAAILQILLPGPRVTGPITPKGNIPVYKDNGFYCFLVTLLAFAILTFGLKLKGLTPTVVYDRFDEILVTLTVYCFFLCCVLYIKGLLAPSTSDCGSTGNPIVDFFWGTELYPRIFGFDIKVFTNCRFGMTVWPLLCLIFAIKSYELNGFVDSMWVSCILQMVYFIKFFWWESGYMRTIDIMLDRAGYYICWGCMVYIPGLYASVSLYLVNHPVHLGPFLSSVILATGIASILINFWADQQKQEVRNTDGLCAIWGKRPDVIRAKYHLENGEVKESILLVSGFWGIARHFHYIPEIMLTFCWSVPGLFENAMVYIYFIWIICLLTHRTFRDDTKCAQKYGQYWVEYCKRVPYKMIPGVF